MSTTHHHISSMSSGQGPTDPELRFAIDSVANFVAMNGPASEEATRQQNFNNPKFAFLFGGEYSDYYKYRLHFAIQNLQPQPPGPSFMPTPNQQIPPLIMHANPVELEERKLEEQIKKLRDQIVDSESNLKAHEVALNTQRQSKVEALWRAQEDKQINDLVKQVGLNIAAFDKLLDRLQESGSKDTILNSKKWIFDNCNSDRSREIILTYLLHRVREKSTTDIFRLHVLYIINDWAHYCQRKKMDSVRQMLSRYVPKLYAYANSNSLNNGFGEKLEKLFGVWEGHKYFDESCYKQLRNPAAIMAAEQAATFADQQQVAIEIDKDISETLNGYTKQHKEYERHMLTKIVAIESQLRDRVEIERRKRQQAEEEERERNASERRRSSRFDQQASQPPPLQNKTSKIPSLLDSMSPPKQQSVAVLTRGPPSQFVDQRNTYPTTPPKEISNMDLTPKAPYYELPAGMMVSLVKLEDITYKPLKEHDLRLPPPEPPSEKLMHEIERFYSALQIPPAIDCVRDADGWEMNGLLEHYIKKTEQRVKIEAKMKEEGKTFEDAFLNKFVPLSLTSKTEPVNGGEQRKKSRSRSASTSSTTSDESSSSGSSTTNSKESSSTPSSTPRKKSKSPSPTIKRRRRSRTPSPEERPSFAAPIGPAPKAASTISFKIPAIPLNRETNKGAQLMAKMGWEGKGLGSKEQGIEEPIQGGDVREKSEQFRGLGAKSDIYDEYRKQMSTQMAKRMQKFDKI